MKTKSALTALLAVVLVFAVAAVAVGFEVTQKAFADSNGQGPPNGCSASSQGFKSSHECKHPPG